FALSSRLRCLAVGVKRVRVRGAEGSATFSIAYPATSPANPMTVLINSGVAFVKRVPRVTVGFLRISIVPANNRGHPTQHVFLVCYRFQVIRVNALRVSA